MNDASIKPIASNCLLKHLRFGHDYPGANINSRVVGQEDNIEPLAASIKAEGILQSLLVCPSPKPDGSFYVIGGNRRLQALQTLAKAGDIDAETYNVPVIVDTECTPQDALRKSLAENDHLPLHPVDRFEAFAAVQEKGQSTAETAARYGIDERIVKQALALGKLSPVVRKAWRGGEIDAEDAKAFTMASDHKTQEAVFKKLKKNSAVSAYYIRKELVGDQREATKLLRFVGKEDFVAAGGKVIENFFDDDDAVSDFALLKSVADEKLAKTIDKLKADGWAWVSGPDSLPHSAEFIWNKLSKGKDCSADQKKSAGCIVKVDYNGKLEITYGVVKPGGKSAKDKPKKKAPLQLSQSLNHRLSIQLTKAAQAAVITDPDIAMTVLLAGLTASEGPVKASFSGFEHKTPRGSFREALKIALAMKPAQRMKNLAFVAASALDLQSNMTSALSNADIAALCAAMPDKALKEAIARFFDAKDYFENAPKVTVLKAIEESCGKDAAKKLENSRGKDIAAFARHNVKNWLPPELRIDNHSKKK